MFNPANRTLVPATPKAFQAATLGQSHAACLPLQCSRFGRCRAFTLAELLVSVSVLLLLVLLATRLLNSAATTTTLSHKQMDADSQARQLLDRMAIDFAHMVKRSDVDYYVKSSATPPPTGVRNLLQPGNDRIGFYSIVPGYYPSSGSQSPVSLVAYRVNSQNKLERMSKGLVWNAVSTSDTPVVFMPIPLVSPLPIAELPDPPPAPLPTPAWQGTLGATDWTDSEVIGPQIFRFEYYYLVRGQVPAGAIPSPAPSPSPSILSDIPWDTRISACPTPVPTPTVTPTPGTPTPAPTPPLLCCHSAPEGMQDVAAVVVTIAVIDPKSKALLDTVDPTGAKLARLNGADGQPPVLADFAAGMTSGQLVAQWRAALDANAIGLPRPAISGIRVYERYLYLSPPTLITP